MELLVVLSIIGIMGIMVVGAFRSCSETREFTEEERVWFFPEEAHARAAQEQAEALHEANRLKLRELELREAELQKVEK